MFLMIIFLLKIGVYCAIYCLNNDIMIKNLKKWNVHPVEQIIILHRLP